jgi:ubiquinone/menaquinone biosynthesis C-methylase UbiE
MIAEVDPIEASGGGGRGNVVSMPVLDPYLGEYELQDGILLISAPRPFQHPEEDYDKQYHVDRMDVATYRSQGEALAELCDEFGWNAGGPVLEIGCGTGRLSLALALSGRFQEILATDPSPAFCGITARKLRALEPLCKHVRVAVMSAEDLERLPSSTFSVIALRSVLHHILDIRQFFFECSRILAPGGLLIFEEPCYEGYVLMGAILQFMPAVLRAQGIEPGDEQLRRIQWMCDTMKWYARRDVDKSAAEDKHLFRPDELMNLCAECHLALDLFPNRLFSNIRERYEPLPQDYFDRFFMTYITDAMQWPADLIDLFDRHVRSYLDYFGLFAEGGAMPYTNSTFVCKKRVEG